MLEQEICTLAQQIDNVQKEIIKLTSKEAHLRHQYQDYVRQHTSEFENRYWKDTDDTYFRTKDVQYDGKHINIVTFQESRYVDMSEGISTVYEFRHGAYPVEMIALLIPITKEEFDGKVAEWLNTESRWLLN